MPNETRQIEFAHGELLDAIASYLGKNAEPGDPGLTADVRVTEKPRPAVAYVLLDESRRETHSSELEPAAVAAALIKYCIAHRIPIPRKSAKSIQVRAGNVVLMLRSTG